VAIITSTFRAVVPLRGMLRGIVIGLVPVVGQLGVFHVGVLVDNCHHVTNGLGVTLEHLPPQFNAVEAFMDVVDDVPVINLRNGIMVSEVPLDVVAEGLIGLLDDAAQIPSGFGAQTGCLVVLDETATVILPAVDGADREFLESVESLTAHHHREVSCHDVVVAVCRSDSDGVGAQPCLGV
jgi:hypothetical protein